ncbi:hypothetical protein H6F83_18705 [Coleofasciculus sp. FACHB-125]|nr:hypothetical protein [Coleofasciculus sp. FACHB-125]
MAFSPKRGLPVVLEIFSPSRTLSPSLVKLKSTKADAPVAWLLEDLLVLSKDMPKACAELGTRKEDVIAMPDAAKTEGKNEVTFIDEISLVKMQV